MKCRKIDVSLYVRYRETSLSDAKFLRKIQTILSQTVRTELNRNAHVGCFYNSSAYKNRLEIKLLKFFHDRIYGRMRGTFVSRSWETIGTSLLKRAFKVRFYVTRLHVDSFRIQPRQLMIYLTSML